MYTENTASNSLTYILVLNDTAEYIFFPLIFIFEIKTKLEDLRSYSAEEIQL